MTTKPAKRRKRIKITSTVGNVCPKCGKDTPAVIRSWADGIAIHHACNKCKIRTLSYSLPPNVYEWVRMQRA